MNKPNRDGDSRDITKSGVEGFEDTIPLKFAHDEIQVTFDFLTDPHYSQHATFYHVGLSILVFIYMLRLLGISMDGPNHYTGRSVDGARDSWLPDEEGYWIILIVLSVPLIIDSAARAALCFLMFYDESNHDLWKILKGDQFERHLMIFEILSGLPLLLNVVYLYPMRNEVAFDDLAESWRLLYRVVELFSFSRFLRVTKDSLSMRALRAVIHNSAQHLLVSFWFFVGFICLSAIVLYFMEPCYDEKVCPWSDMFDSSWFSMVTMTTVGYGDMVPQYEHGRLLATIIMFFGSIFTSMPLAIIGNEYEQIWEQLKKEQAIEELRKKKLRVGKAIHKLDENVMKKMQQSAILLQENAIKNTRVDSDAMKATKKKALEESQLSQRGGEGVMARDVKTILMSAVKSVRATTARLKIVIGHMKEKRKPGMKLGSVVNYKVNSVSPEMLLTMSLLREWLMLLRITLDRSIRLTEAGCIDPDIMGELEKKVAITEKEAFELLSGERVAAVEAKKEKKAKKHKKKQKKKRVMERQIKRRGHAQRGNLARQTFLTADEKFEEMKKRIEHRRRSSAHQRVSLTQLPSLSAEMYERARRMNNEIWAAIIVTGTNRVSPAADANKARHLHQDEYVDSATGEVHHHKHHHRPFLARYVEAREKQVQENFYSYRNRLYPLLLKPDSSPKAEFLNKFMMVMVLMSIALLFCQSLTSYQTFGEDTQYCQNVVNIYCRDKSHMTDPACYVQSADSTGVATPLQKLSFDCDESNCYGYGPNFGSPTSLMSCRYRSDSVYWLDPDFAAQNMEQVTFRTRFELSTEYGVATIFTPRYDMQIRSDVCGRIECRLDSKAEYSMDGLFVIAEIALSTLFTVEVVLRAYAVGNTAVYFLLDKSHILDVLALVPFYMTIFLGGSMVNNMYLMPYIYGGVTLQYLRALKVTRLFRVMQHFRSSRSLFETGYKAGPHISTVLSFLLCIVIIFSLVFFEVESGDACIISDESGSGLNGRDMCGVDETTGMVEIEGKRLGNRIVVDKNGDYSQFRDAFQCMWYCFVTITTVGYGDYFPVTNKGALLTLALMVLGNIYMAIPFTAIGTIFYETHLKNSAELREETENKKNAEQLALMVENNEMERLHELTHIRSGRYVSSLFKSMYSRVDNLMADLLKPREDIKIEFEPDEDNPGELRAIQAKAPSRSMQRFIDSSNDGYALLSRTTGVLFDLTIFANAKEEFYTKNVSKFSTAVA